MEGRFPLFGESLGEAHGEEPLLKVWPAVEEEKTDDRCQGHNGLHGDPGRGMDGAHKDAHGRHPEVRARQLEPLRSCEPRLDPAGPGPGERYAHESLVLAPREHKERVGWDTKVF